MKAKEITIYDNYYSRDREEEVREYLFEEYADDDNWKSPEDISDERVFDEINFQARMAWNEVVGELHSMVDRDVYILFGICGRWDGPAQNGKFIFSIDDLLCCINHLDYLRIYDRNGHLYIHGSHHDGSDDYELKCLTNKGCELAEKTGYAHDRHLHETIINNNFYSSLPRYAKRVYGI